MLSLSYLLLILLYLFPFTLSSPLCEGTDTTRYISSQRPVEIESTKNGKLYTWTHENSKKVIKIITVHGNATEMGTALGFLLRNELPTIVKSILPHYIEKGKKFLRDAKVPEFLINILMIIGEKLFYFLLDVTWIITKQYTNVRVYDEIRAVANASKIPYLDLLRLSMFPELIKAKCSLVGAWGAATRTSGPYFLRALDWDVENPVTNYPLIVVYDSTEKGSIKYANIGYSGLLGSLTAVNRLGVVIGEKAWYPNSQDAAKIGFVGAPWHYIFRDVGQFATNRKSILDMMSAVPRTATIHVGIITPEIGGHNEYRAMHFAQNKLNVYDDTHFPQSDQFHPLKPGIVYWDKGIQPTRDYCFKDLLTESPNYGNITPEYLAKSVTAIHKTGNAYYVLFDAERKEMIMSYSTYKGKMAYEEDMFKISYEDLFNLA